MLCVAPMACSPRDARGPAGDAAAADSASITSGTTAAIESAFGLHVLSLALTRDRADLTLAGATPAPDADAEYRKLRAVAEWLWRRAPFDSLADTISIAVTRSGTAGAAERNTYFYYRRERQAP